MLKRYSDTDMLWDTEKEQWTRPFKKSIEPVAAQLPATKPSRPIEAMSWKEILFDTYKTCRHSENWEKFKFCHDAEDQSTFDGWDQMTLKKG